MDIVVAEAMTTAIRNIPVIATYWIIGILTVLVTLLVLLVIAVAAMIATKNSPVTATRWNTAMEKVRF